MTLQEFRDILLAADPQASHYKSMQTPNYTVWREFGKRAIPEQTWKIQVDRYTKIEYDPVVALITTALNIDDIAYEYLCDFEKDTGYIHHIWDCEVA